MLANLQPSNKVGGRGLQPLISLKVTDLIVSEKVKNGAAERHQQSELIKLYKWTMKY